MSGMSIVAIVLAILGAGAILVILVLVALLLPAVSAGREAARRVYCSNNMKQIALAMHNYHDKYGSFPPAYTVDANGKKLHSWRTLILPYLEQGVIYDQIDFNEPWDSPKNQAIGALPIKAFQCPSQDHSGLGSSYVVLTGPNTMFSSPKGTKLSEVTDGTSNTILIVEAAGVNSNWMEPTDLDMNLFVQGSAAKPPHAGSFNVGFADGAVRGMKGTLSADERKALATRNGGEIVPMSP
jgi:prepilin-type processing-associated H-X9-DG protein